MVLRGHFCLLFVCGWVVCYLWCCGTRGTPPVVGAWPRLWQWQCGVLQAASLRTLPRPRPGRPAVTTAAAAAGAFRSFFCGKGRLPTRPFSPPCCTCLHICMRGLAWLPAHCKHAHPRACPVSFCCFCHNLPQVLFCRPAVGCTPILACRNRGHGSPPFGVVWA